MTVFWPTQTTYGLDFPMDFLRPIASHRIRGAVVNDGQTPIFPSKNRLEEPALSQSAMQQAKLGAEQAVMMLPSASIDDFGRFWSKKHVQM